MSTYYAAATWSHSDDATFRAWGSQVSAALDAIGLAKNGSDSGHINWTTVSIPTTNAYAGYEIRSFSDTAQGANPYWFKFEFGTGSSATYPRMGISVGTGTNNAGALTGTTGLAVATFTPAGAVSGSGALSACRTSDGCFWLLCTGMTNLSWHFLLERRKNLDGSTHSSGDCSFLATSTATPDGSLFSYSRTALLNRSAAISTVSPLSWASSGSGMSGADFAVTPIYGCFPEIEPLESMVCYRSADGLTTGTTHAATFLRQRTYRATGFQLASGSNSMFAGVWE